jgi:hypothetical protein
MVTKKESKPVIRMRYVEFDSAGKTLYEKIVEGYIATADVPAAIWVNLPQYAIEKELGLEKGISILVTELGYKIKNANWEERRPKR